MHVQENLLLDVCYNVINYETVYSSSQADIRDSQIFYFEKYVFLEVLNCNDDGNYLSFFSRVTKAKHLGVYHGYIRVVTNCCNICLIKYIGTLDRSGVQISFEIWLDEDLLLDEDDAIIY